MGYVTGSPVYMTYIDATCHCLPAQCVLPDVFRKMTVAESGRNLPGPIPGLNLLSYEVEIVHHGHFVTGSWASTSFSHVNPHWRNQDPGKYTKMPHPKVLKFCDFYPNHFGQFLSEIGTTPSPYPIFIQIPD